jgi:trehalose utilization protein
MTNLSTCIRFLLLLGVATLPSIHRTRAASHPIRVLVWDEQQPAQKQAYDNFIGNEIANYLKTCSGLAVSSGRLDDPEQGLSKQVLDNADVLIWWGHVRHGDVKAETAQDIVRRVKSGQLSLIALHSAHWSKPFVEAMNERAREDALKPLSEAERAHVAVTETNQYAKFFTQPKFTDARTPWTLYRKFADDRVEIMLALPNCCFPAYRGDGKPSSMRTLLAKHPIARDLPAQFTIPQTEMYNEPFHVPAPDAVIFEERWENGEWFRSGSLWQIGQGKVFYFRPGHETYPVFKQAAVLKIIENAARWMPGGN